MTLVFCCAACSSIPYTKVEFLKRVPVNTNADILTMYQKGLQVSWSWPDDDVVTCSGEKGPSSS